jgi:hypothetical protein
MNTRVLKLSLLIFFTIINTRLFSQVIFPRAFAFAIDDLGWNIGNDDGDVDNQGPYRIGIDRKMDLENYKPIVEVGKTAGVRIQSLFVLAEMDRLNILRKHPSTTWMGKDWDNTKNINQEQIDIMSFVRDNAAYMEFGLHGVGHEHWVNSKKNRAEWYSTDDNASWPEDTVKAHIQCFKDIMAQYGLDEAHGQRFPESFVPTAYGYYWNPGANYSTGKLLSENGLKYVNTLFDYIEELNPPKGPNGGGFDNGVIVVNRINYGNEWWRLSSLPTVPLEEQESDIIETHWSNWLAQDDFLQAQTVQEFVEYYQMVQKSKDRYCAKNTEQFHSQWLYNKYTTLTQKSNNVYEIDNTKMPNEAYYNDILGVMVLKIPLKNNEHVSIATLNGKPIPAYFEDFNWGYLYLPVLKQEKYELKYEIGSSMMPLFVLNTGTYNVYDFTKDKNKVTIDLEMYGNQTLTVKCDNPKTISTNNKNLIILSNSYDNSSKILSIELKGIDIQGERGLLTLSY